MRRVGVGYRPELAPWIATGPACVNCLEVTAEHFFDADPRFLGDLGQRFDLVVHGLGLSLGTPGPLDAEYLSRFAQVVRHANPLWVSEHIAFTRTQEVDLGHLNPLAWTEENLQVLIDHAIELREACAKPLLLENITSHVRPGGTYRETEFLNRLCERAGCGLLLDVTNLFVNSRNHRFDPVEWIEALDPRLIRQLHVVGYSRQQDRWEDWHAQSIQPDLWELIERALEYAPVDAVILERDANFGDCAQLEAELERLAENVRT